MQGNTSSLKSALAEHARLMQHRAPGRSASDFKPGQVPQFDPSPSAQGSLKTIRIYPYGVARNRLMQAAKRLGVPAIVVRDANEADALVTLCAAC